MAFPSSSGTKSDDLSRAWNLARDAAARAKASATSVRDVSAAGLIFAQAIVNLMSTLASVRDDLARAAAVTGIAAYAQMQVNDPALNVAAEFTAMTNAIDAVRTWIATNFPKDGSGFLLYHSFDAQGRVTSRTLSPAQTAGLRTQLDVLIGTID